MAEPQIRFDDGAAYERMMGVWSRSAGDIFLDWLAPRPSLRFVDVGCGNGAFTELLAERCAPKEIQGIDPSEAQIAFARTRHAKGIAEFRTGDAMNLPFPDARFDAAVMALVLFFVPDPARGLAEMVRVVKPGGSVSAYVWDVPAGGLPAAPIQAEMRAMGRAPPLPPSFEISREPALRALWTDADLHSVETKPIAVQRTFDDFEAFWATNLLGGGIAAVLTAMPPDEVAALKDRVRARMRADSSGRITCSAQANAVKGLVPN